MILFSTDVDFLNSTIYKPITLNQFFKQFFIELLDFFIPKHEAKNPAYLSSHFSTPPISEMFLSAKSSEKRIGGPSIPSSFFRDEIPAIFS